MKIFTGILRSLRPNVWQRIFAEVLFGASLVPHAITHLANLLLGLILIGPFIGGALYLFNDITDRKYDAQHPFRKNRPVASGNLSRTPAIIAVIILLITSLFISFIFSPILCIICSLLIVSQIFYTLPQLRLKEIAFFDIALNMVNAFLRFLAGYVVVGGLIGTFPFYFAGFAIGVKTILFLGHRWQNRKQEIESNFKSSVTFLSFKSFKFILGVLLVGCFYFYLVSVFVYHLPRVVILYPFLSGLFLIPLFPHLKELGKQEKSEYFRNFLYIDLFLFSLIFFLTVQIVYN